MLGHSRRRCCTRRRGGYKWDKYHAGQSVRDDGQDGEADQFSVQTEEQFCGHGPGIIECNSKVAMFDHLGYSFTIDVNVQGAGRPRALLS